MSKYARDHAHCGDQVVQSRGHPNQNGRGPLHTPPDQAGFPSTNSTVFNPKILEASIKEIASRLVDDAKADLLLYAAKKLDVSHERWALFHCMVTAGPSFRACGTMLPSHSFIIKSLLVYLFVPPTFPGARARLSRGNPTLVLVRRARRFVAAHRAQLRFQCRSP